MLHITLSEPHSSAFCTEHTVAPSLRGVELVFSLHLASRKNVRLVDALECSFFVQLSCRVDQQIHLHRDDDFQPTLLRHGRQLELPITQRVVCKSPFPFRS